MLRRYASARVIHLMRHPYEVAHSRVKVDWAERPPLQEVCRSSLRDLRAAMRHGWQEAGRYMLVRYEDLPMRPFDTVRRVHAFMGIERTVDEAALRLLTNATAAAAADADADAAGGVDDIRAMLADERVAGEAVVASADLVDSIIQASTSAGAHGKKDGADASEGGRDEGSPPQAAANRTAEGAAAATAKVSQKDLEDYGIVRRKTVCGDCRAEAVRAVEEAPACAELLQLVPMGCCGEHMRAPQRRGSRRMS